MGKTVSTMSGPDGLVHWDGCKRGIPEEIARGIQSLRNLESLGKEQLKGALKRTGFELSEAELCGIFEQECGMKAEDAQRRAKLFFEFLKAKS